MNDILSVLFYQPIVNLLLLLYKIGFENLGIAVIAITIIIRLLLWPLYKKQLQSQERMRKIQPKIKALQSQKKKATEYTQAEREMLGESTKAMGAGCLPTLIQLPFLFALYNTISNIITDKADKISDLAYFDFLRFPHGYHFNTHFLGIDLSNVPGHIGFGSWTIVPLLIIVALTVVTQYFSMKLSTANLEDKKADSKKEDEKNKNKKNKAGKDVLAKKEEPTPEDMQKAINKQMVLIFPVMIGFFAFNFAAILGLYWFMQNTLAIIQTLIHNKKINIFPWTKISLKKK